ncbi:probable glutamate carboxypeptidase VP8 [Aristolochia californica]|uniref:probable glutamate carboxypeptidase VP8 n=1 Tax=Aristolochia californica TaxID=171875 RepID=UPI0035E27CEC
MAPTRPQKSSPLWDIRLLFCSLAFLAFLCLTGYYSLHHYHHSKSLLVSDLHRLFLDLSEPSAISASLRSLTSGPHLAGTQQGIQTTEYVLARFRDSGLDAHVAEYQALLSYPAHVSVSALFRNGTVRAFPRGGEAGSGLEGSPVVAPYHAYSPSGAGHAPAVFVNHGRDEDYLSLRMLGVNVSGCVAVMRRGGGSRGAVVQRAAIEGAAAVLMYTEGEVFRDGVERGTVMMGLGDPLTPGWTHAKGGQVLDVDDPTVRARFPAIPSMPISAEVAAGILDSLGGPRAPDDWKEDGLRNKRTRVGPGPTLVNFTYQEDRKIADIQNVLAVIKGREEPDRFVLLGNHRDAWTYGAVDPNSGTAVLLDIARRFGLLLRKGWVPRRTIVLCSWDAEEFGMIGSTEWVEENLENLRSKAVAYLNVDCAVQGPGLFARASPQLDDLLLEVVKKVNDPDVNGKTVYQTWILANNGTHIERFNEVDSDFAAFVQHAGVPSVDLYYGKDFPVYHTAFDTFEWMKKYGDPLFHRHVAVAEIWGLLTLHLVDSSILPFNYLSYAAQLQEHRKKLSSILDRGISLYPIDKAIEELISAAHETEKKASNLGERKALDDFSELRTRMLNDQMMLSERGFLDADGLKGRLWFKHLIYGPPGDYNSELFFFPGIADAISQATKMSKREGQTAIEQEIWRVARAIQRAAISLRGNIT